MYYNGDNKNAFINIKYITRNIIGTLQIVEKKNKYWSE